MAVTSLLCLRFLCLPWWPKVSWPPFCICPQEQPICHANTSAGGVKWGYSPQCRELALLYLFRGNSSTKCWSPTAALQHQLPCSLCFELVHFMESCWGYGSVFNWVLPEAEPKARIQTQVVSSGSAGKPVERSKVRYMSVCMYKYLKRMIQTL